ncbi:MAG: hypothetical protein WCW30_04565 [Candidatus Gracilibacteria bacterium]
MGSISNNRHGKFLVCAGVRAIVFTGIFSFAIQGFRAGSALIPCFEDLFHFGKGAGVGFAGKIDDFLSKIFGWFWGINGFAGKSVFDFAINGHLDVHFANPQVNDVTHLEFGGVLFLENHGVFGPHTEVNDRTHVPKHSGLNQSGQLAHVLVSHGEVEAIFAGFG